MTVYYARAIWLWLTERVAVEIVRLKTGRLRAACRWLLECVGPLPSLHPYAGHHTETRADTKRLDNQWAIQLHDIAADLDPLPLYDEGIAIRERYRREAWAATGTTPDEYWASVTPSPDLPSHRYDNADMATHGSSAGAGEPTPNQAMNLWRANDVIPPRIAATLARAQADQTVIDSDLTPATRAALVEEFAGGDPYNGEGEHWFDRFDAIEARAHERLQQARAELDRWFTPVGVS